MVIKRKKSNEAKLKRVIEEFERLTAKPGHWDRTTAQGRCILKLASQIPGKEEDR